MHDCKMCKTPNCCGKNGGACCNEPNVDKSNTTTDPSSKDDTQQKKGMNYNK